MDPSAESTDFMSAALQLAREAGGAGEVPVGAVVVRDGKVVGRGRNTREHQNDPTGHAEIAAIRDAAAALGSWRLPGCVLYVTLEPCPMCLGAAQQARLAEVVYGTRDPKGGALSLGYALHEDTRTNHRFSVRCEETAECGRVLTEFFRKMRSE